MTRYLVLLVEPEMRTPWKLFFTKNWANINFKFLKMAAQNKWQSLNSCQYFDSITSSVLVSFLEECYYSINVVKNWKSETNKFSCFSQLEWKFSYEVRQTRYLEWLCVEYFAMYWLQIRIFVVLFDANTFASDSNIGPLM